MVPILTLFLLTCGIRSVPAESNPGGINHPARAAVIAYAKNLDVATLDASLSSERLEVYLRRVLPHDVMVAWTSSDCDLKPDTFPRPPDHPLCASVRATRGRAELHLEIRTGTHGIPIHGSPTVAVLWLAHATGDRKRPIETEALQSLGELSRAFRRVSLPQQPENKQMQRTRPAPAMEPRR